MNNTYLAFSIVVGGCVLKFTFYLKEKLNTAYKYVFSGRFFKDLISTENLIK